ncbi:MAG: adenylate/guanylate cyclase domain-containing protein, partial [Pseudomonadota bacterium]
RRETRPFDEDQIELLRAFAAQAVIAIGNVRQFRELQSRLEREAATREILEFISRSRDDDEPVFDMITQSALRLSRSWDASLMVVSEDGRTLETVAAHGWDDAIRTYMDANPPKLTDPASTYAQVVISKEPVQIVDIRATDRYRAGTTGRRLAVDQLGLNTMLHVTLVHQGHCLGVISVYRKEVQAYTEDDIELLRIFASQAVIAIENVRQFKALEALNVELGDRVAAQVGEIERMGRLKRFLSPAVAETVVTKGEEMLSSHRALIATLFCDIRGFTAFCETAEPEETIEVLQTYHEEMGELISAHGGGIDKRMGDGIMVILNDPLPCEDPAGDAVRLAIAMRARMRELCKGWKRLGHRLGFGVGISLGYATVGMVGSEGRYDYTASGTAVNLAARLCDRAKDGEILLSPRARTAIEDDFQTEAIGEIDFKGLREPVEVFRLAVPD